MAKEMVVDPVFADESLVFLLVFLSYSENFTPVIEENCQNSRKLVLIEAIAVLMSKRL